ncbi:LysR family transcriptional regulator [uncultured Roseobacter sp.]|uniref:LysR family transcriptional regulator n=1 Tax=uncultured Roseobacter sp. TaxID=114847 RepID=UPI002628BA5C|nr:LysR family transcriptional regulator [uncultured Roseobacter sp.]
MNWDAISFDWNHVRAFLATAEEGTFSAAARALKTSQPTIGRQISELENRLGVTLLERSIKGPKLTDAGEKLLHHVRGMSDAAAMISMAAVGQSKEVAGAVRITAADMLAVQLLPQILVPLREKAPGIRPELMSSNTIKDLLQREADIAVRHVRPDQPELIARHVGDLKTHLYASRAYLDQKGRPKTPRDIADYSFVGVPDGTDVVATLRDLGIPLTQANFVVTSDSGVVISGCVKAGYGLSLLPAALCDPEPELERVLPEIPTPQFPIWLVTHRELQTSRRIRIVFDQLAHGLSRAARTI